MGKLDWLKDRIRKWIAPRQNTDMESEILNIILAPIYVCTITSVYYYSLFYVMPYHFPMTSEVYSADMTSHERGHVGDGEGGWCSNLLLHRVILTMIYFQMMTNWMCIRFVGNKLDTSRKSSQPNNSLVNEHSLQSATQNQKLKTDQDSRAKCSPRSYPNGNRKTQTEKNKSENQHTSVTEPKRSYWSWNLCRKCGHDSPPRCHHCPLCETCSLKRDHHCFFSGRCVGFNNQRYFIVFLLWAVFGTSYSTLYFVPYLRYELWNSMSCWDLVPPFALLRWIFGSGSGFVTAVLFTFLFNFLFICLSSTFLVEQYSLICSGLTQFETKSLNKKKLNIVDSRDFGVKVRAVLGRNYGLSLVIPLTHLLFTPCENPYDWPDLEIWRSNKSN